MRRAAGLVVVISLAIVVGKVRAAKAPKIGHPASKLERIEVAAAVATREDAWRQESEETFPRDHWSARDDYASREYSFVGEAAIAHHVRIEDVLHAIDEDIHENGGEKRAADAVPTKPRPFYD